MGALILPPDDLLVINGNFQDACKRGDYQEVIRCIEQGANEWNLGLQWACHNGNPQIIQLLLSHGARYTFGALAESCRHSDSSLFFSIIKQIGAPEDKTGCFEHACQSGNMEILTYLNQHFNDYGYQPQHDSRLEYAVRTGRLDLVQWVLSHKRKFTKSEVSSAFCVACRVGEIRIVRILIDLGAKNYNKGLQAAYNNGHTEIVKLMISLGATNYNQVVDYNTTRKTEDNSGIDPMANYY